MTTSDVDRIFEKLDGISDRMARVETKQDATAASVTEMKGDIKILAVNGCAKAASHADHESRVRLLESWQVGHDSESKALASAAGGRAGAAWGTGIAAIISGIAAWLSSRS